VPVAKKPSGYYQILVLGAMLRLNELGYQNLQVSEVFTMLTQLGLVREDDQDARAAIGVAFHSDAAKELRRDFAEEQGHDGQ